MMLTGGIDAEDGKKTFGPGGFTAGAVAEDGIAAEARAAVGGGEKGAAAGAGIATTAAGSGPAAATGGEAAATGGLAMGGQPAAWRTT